MNDLSELRHAFAQWLDTSGVRPADGGALHDTTDGVRVSPPSGATDPSASAEVATPIVRRTPGELLYALWDDHTPLPSTVRQRHALPADTSYADLARILYVEWDTGDVASLEVARDGLAQRDRDELATEFERVRRTGMATA